MASLNLRTRSYGGWWGGLGDEACPYIDDTGFCTDVNPSGEAPITYDPAYQAMLSAQAAENAASGITSDFGTPTSTPPPTSDALAKAILAFSQAGIKAVAPNMTSGVCPTGYIRNGAACTPPVAAQSAQSASAPLIAGVSNQTLFLIAGGFLFLMMLSSGGGGRRR